MAKASFYLHNNIAGRSDESLIFLSFSFNGKRVRVSTGEKVNEKYWHKEQQQVRKTHKEYDTINIRIKAVAENYNNAYRLLKSDNKPITATTLQAKIDQLTGKVADNKRLFGFIADFIEKAEGRVTAGTIKSYKTTQAVLIRFKTSRKRGFDFDDIDLNFYDDYYRFLTKGLGYSANTVGKHIKNLKVFMREASERRLTNNTEFLKKRFKVPKEEIDNIYLSEEEILRLHHLDLRENQNLRFARDLFIVGCYTGLRFSDFSQLKKENIRDGKISVRTQKTGELVSIPVHPIVEEIMSEYKGKYVNSLPPAFANQVMNGYLKILGEKAGFEESFIIKKTKGGKKIEETFKKWQLMTTHTARRSFASNLFLQDFPAISIMKITGHRSEKNFLTYLKMTPHENAEKLRKHWENVGKTRNLKTIDVTLELIK